MLFLFMTKVVLLIILFEFYFIANISSFKPFIFLCSQVEKYRMFLDNNKTFAFLFYGD